MSALELEDLLVKVFRSGLEAADLARCACVSKQWRDAAMLCPSQWFIYKKFRPIGRWELCMYDLERNKSHRVPMAQGFDRILCSSHGVLVVTSASRIMIGDPLKNKWFVIPEEVPFKVYRGDVLPNLTLFVSGEDRVALYDLKTKQWRIRNEKRDICYNVKLVTIGNTVNFINKRGGLATFDSENEQWEEKHWSVGKYFKYAEALEPENADARVPLVRGFGPGQHGAVVEVQGDRVTKVAWFEEVMNSLKKRMGDSIPGTCFTSSSEVLLWLAHSGKKAFLYYKREKIWKEFELDVGINFVSHFSANCSDCLTDLIPIELSRGAMRFEKSNVV